VATIYDVARRAGVSISTVSYALNNTRPITAATRSRIEEAVRELGYQPNAGARMLASTRTNIFALTAPMHTETYAPTFMAFVLAVVTAARAHDFDVLLLTESDAVDGLRRVAARSLVDGVVVMDVSREDTRLDVVRELGLPASLLGVPGDPSGLVCVDLDFERAGAIAVEHVHGRGHSAIGLLGHTQSLYDRGSNFALRFRDAFLSTAAATGTAAAFVPADPTPTGIAAALDELRTRIPAMTALVLDCNERVHDLLLEVLRLRGVRVPDDLSLVSACSAFTTDHFGPPLDVIPLPAPVMGRRVVERLLAQLSGTVEPHVELIEPTYVAKGSVVTR
jgi:DNA-binding LacI/PurR family transcriptional regulator